MSRTLILVIMVHTFTVIFISFDCLFEMFLIISIELIQIGEKITCNECTTYTIFSLLNKRH